MKLEGKEIIRKKRLILREKYLLEDLPIWEEISRLNPNDNDFKIKIGKDSKITVSYPKSKNNRGFFQERAASICDKIFRIHATHFGINKRSEIKLYMIIEIAKIFCEAPKQAQLYWCRDPSRTGSDEKTQIESLEEYTNKEIKINRLDPGEKTVTNGTITENSDNIPVDQSSRSIDVECASKKFTAYGFLKYSNPIGSVTSSLQPGETFSYLNECKKYCEQKKNSIYFFAQIDGIAGEKEIPKMKKHVGNNERIFIGNTKDVINWLNNLYEK